MTEPSKPAQRRRRRKRPPVTSPGDLREQQAHAKGEQALKLRLAGFSYGEIAQQVGYSDRGGAYKACQAALTRSMPEPNEELRHLELVRLERLQMAIWARALGGDPKAIDSALQIMGRRAKLSGLDVPRVLQHEGTDAQKLHEGQMAILLQAMMLMAAQAGMDQNSREVKLMMAEALRQADAMAGDPAETMLRVIGDGR